jgi:hypothetical protein
MTPLACELLEDVYGEIFIRPTRDFHNPHAASKFLQRVFHECKFFECTAVWPLVGQLGKAMFDGYELYGRVDQRLAFLPAPATWVEFEFPSIRDLVGRENRAQLINNFFCPTPEAQAQVPYTYRAAFVFLGQNDSTHLADRYQISCDTSCRLQGPRVWRIHRFPALPLVHSNLRPQRSYEHSNRDGETRRFDKPVPAIDDFVHYATLALINSPRVVGQRGHYPHGRMERERLKKLKLVGKFPPRAWTEILLEVAPNPKDHRTGTPEEMHLTGERCPHYCRTYLRVRHGMLEYVEGHWRGNPALGMKRSRYRLEKERQPEGGGV